MRKEQKKHEDGCKANEGLTSSLAVKTNRIGIGKVTIMTFKSLLDEMHETYKKKNSDYGNSFKQTHLQFGEIAGLVRISDKVNRLISLSKKDDSGAYFESKRDTYMDLANYCLMQVLVMEEVGEKQEEIMKRYREVVANREV